MARIVVIGAGMAGHSTALGLRHKLEQEHEIIVISPGKVWVNPDSLAQIAANLQDSEREIIELGPLYRSKGVIFHQGMARAIYPGGTREDERPQVEMVFTGSYLNGEVARVPYDYLVIATGHDIDKVAGLPAEAATVPTCVIDRLDSAQAGAVELRRLVSELQDSPLDMEPKRIAVGRSYRGMGGYYGALEYILALDSLLRSEGLRSRVELHFFDAGQPWIADLLRRGPSVGPALLGGDEGAFVKAARRPDALVQDIENQVRRSLEQLLDFRGIALHAGMRMSGINGMRLRFLPVEGADVYVSGGTGRGRPVFSGGEVRAAGGGEGSGGGHWGRTAVGGPWELTCDLVVTEASRVLTPLKVWARDGEDISSRLYDGWGRLRVDASRAEDERTGKMQEVWPKTFRNPSYSNIFAIGSAIALDTREPDIRALESGEESLRNTGGQPRAQHSPIQTRDMSHLMSARVSEQIFTEITGTPAKNPVESLEEIEAVVNLAWDSSLVSSCGFYAEVQAPAVRKRRGGGEKSDESAVAEVGLETRRGMWAYWSIRLERFIERYRAKGRPLWWLLPS